MGRRPGILEEVVQQVRWKPVGNTCEVVDILEAGAPDNHILQEEHLEQLSEVLVADYEAC